MHKVASLKIAQLPVLLSPRESIARSRADLPETRLSSGPRHPVLWPIVHLDISGDDKAQRPPPVAHVSQNSRAAEILTESMLGFQITTSRIRCHGEATSEIADMPCLRTRHFIGLQSDEMQRR